MASNTDEIWTVARVLIWTTGYFREHGLENPRLEAEILLAHALGQDRLQLYLDHHRPLHHNELTAYRRLIAQRREGTPTAYLTGHKEFWSLDFEVDRRVLIPRPETELLVEAVINRLREKPAVLLADIGTGSGAIAVALAKTLPQARVWAVDIAAEALAVARGNAERHQVTERIEFVAGNLGKPLIAQGLEGKLDALVANLPYIPTADLNGLQREVQFEPRMALDGGADGLDLFRQLLQQAPVILQPGGLLAIEFGIGQAIALSGILDLSIWESPVVIKDYAGLERHLICYRK